MSGVRVQVRVRVMRQVHELALGLVLRPMLTLLLRLEAMRLKPPQRIDTCPDNSLELGLV